MEISHPMRDYAAMDKPTVPASFDYSRIPDMPASVFVAPLKKPSGDWATTGSSPRSASTAWKSTGSGTNSTSVRSGSCQVTPAANSCADSNASISAAAACRTSAR